MTREVIGKVPILHIPSRKFRDATLISGIEDRHLADIETHWYPLLQRVHREIHLECEARGETDRQSLLNAFGARDAQDSHWDWRSKRKAVSQHISRRAYVLECDEAVQAAMIVDLVKRCQHPEQLGQHLVYIDYIAAAPWNRTNFDPPRRYRGIGRVLMGTAISLSIEEGFNGRLGLHALPQAESFYEHKCGMCRVGVDPNYHGLSYFEFTPDAALAFIHDVT
jgi:GNAT superfamily N-acetyltransferase